MKKLTTLLAVLLSLVMLAAPISAGAENLDMVALQISDPTVSINGQSMIDLTGLTLQLAGGANADMTLGQLFLDILGGGNAVTSAMVQVDENGLAGFVGGMSKAYGIPMATLTALFEQATASMGDVNAMVEESSAVAQQIANWTLPQQIAELIVGYVETNKAPAQNYTKELSLTSGAVSAEFVSSSVDCNALIPQVAALLDSDELAREFLVLMNAEGAIYAESYTELLSDTGINWTVVTGSASGDNFSAEDMILKMENGGEVVNIAFTSLTEGTADGSHTALEVSIYPEASEFAGEEVYATLDITAGSIVTIAGHFGYNFGSDDAYDLALMASITEGGFSGMLSDTMGMINASCSLVPGSFDLTIAVDGESMNFYCNWSDAGFSVGFNAGAAGSLDLSYVAEANDAYFFKGKLNFTMNDGYDTYAASLGIGVVPGVVDSANTYIAPEMVTDITLMSEEDMAAAETEIMTVLQNTVMTLSQYVPGLQAIMGGM